MVLLAAAVVVLVVVVVLGMLLCCCVMNQVLPPFALLVQAGARPGVGGRGEGALEGGRREAADDRPAVLGAPGLGLRYSW